MGTVGLQAWSFVWDYLCEMMGMVKPRWGGDASGKQEMEVKPTGLLLEASASPSSPSAFTEICLLPSEGTAFRAGLPRSAQDCYKTDSTHMHGMDD